MLKYRLREVYSKVQARRSAQDAKPIDLVT